MSSQAVSEVGAKISERKQESILCGHHQVDFVEFSEIYIHVLETTCHYFWNVVTLLWTGYQTKVHTEAPVAVSTAGETENNATVCFFCVKEGILMTSEGSNN